jgi:hypothetical protein
MAESRVCLSRSALARVAGLAIGIVTIQPGDAAPAARLCITDSTTGDRQNVTVRTGDNITVGICTVLITGIVNGDHAHVDFVVNGGSPSEPGDAG